MRHGDHPECSMCLRTSHAVGAIGSCERPGGEGCARGVRKETKRKKRDIRDRDSDGEGRAA